ncbi:MAG: YicC/YloC family endoribonuclease [Acidobacteriota bacterium]
MNITMPTPLRSMTGFARARRSLGDGEVVVSLKTVNHRGLDIHMHAPASADALENAIRGVIKAGLSRGHVDVRITVPDLSRDDDSATSVNHKLLEQYIRAFREAAAAHNLHSEPDLNAALRLPGMFDDGGIAEPPPELEAVLMGAVTAAMEELNAFRTREGAEIAKEMQKHNQQVAAAADAIESIRGSAVATFQARLNERLKELLSTVQIEPQRLVQEAAILADRSDVGEEIARLRIHSSQLGVLLDSGGEVGKKLDFLLQEMNREANTILSKTSGIGEIGLKITDLALGAKAAIEKIREQSLNLE